LLVAALAITLGGCVIRMPPRVADSEPNCRPGVLVICIFAGCRDIARAPDAPPAGPTAPR
jgi:hypothetical protein